MPVEVKGVLETRKVLKQYAPELAKESQKEMAQALKPIVKTARGFLPSNSQVPSGWLVQPNAKGRWGKLPVAYEASLARRGVTYSTTPTRANRSGFKSLATIWNKSASGAIYETAGRKSGIQGNFTPRLGGMLQGDSQKMRGRVIFRVWSRDNGKTTAAVLKAIEKTNAKAAAIVRKAS